MKGIDIFCTSQAATSICLSMDEPSSSSATAPLAGGRAIDRHNPIIRDSRRIATSVLPPCTISHPPISPKPQKVHHHAKKKKNRKIPFNEDVASVNKLEFEKMKSSTNDVNGGVIRKGWSCTKPGDFISPPGSTRYLLRDKALFNDSTESDPPLPPPTAAVEKSSYVKTEEALFESNTASSESHDSTEEQVVVLKVSLHCRGCERKLRKHLSRMEGVTSFNIEFMAKKVTVTGKVTPLGVLSSISKVKNAQLWNPSIHSSSFPPPFKNDQKEAGA